MNLLNPAQIEEFERRGFLRLPGLIPDDLLARLRAMFDRALVPGQATDQLVTAVGDCNFVTNLDLLCNKDDLSCLELLGLPPILEIARNLCGDDFFPIQEWAVIKHRGDDQSVLWHQDMVHGRTGICFTMGIYLDDAAPGDGALQVIEGSHTAGRDICALLDQPRTEVPMQAGDVLIHDMMLAHGSEPLSGNPVRRVIYIEFLSAAHVAREGIYSPELVERRTRLIYAAVRQRAKLCPDEHGFTPPLPNPVSADAELPLAAVLAEIYAEPIKARPSSYCVNGRPTFTRFD